MSSTKFYLTFSYTITVLPNQKFTIIEELIYTNLFLKGKQSMSPLELFNPKNVSKLIFDNTKYCIFFSFLTLMIKINSQRTPGIKF